MDSSPSVSTGVVQTLNMLALALRIHTKLQIDISRPLKYLKGFPKFQISMRIFMSEKNNVKASFILMFFSKNGAPVSWSPSHW